MNVFDTIKTDVLIIGAGGAGLRAAIEAKKHNVKVIIITKEPFGEAHTTKAMGGLNVAIKPPATPKQHFEDTIKGGWYINNFKLVDIFTREMPQRIYDLEKYGTKFDRLPDGTFYTWAGGKQSAPLNLCAGDYTGREMMRGLVGEIRRLNIAYLDKHYCTKILAKDKQIIGTLLIDSKTGNYKFIHTKAIILASGGAGQLYKITSNEPGNTGEGYAWAIELGAEVVDMEMVQFHPTGIAYPPHKRGVLVTEKVRGHLGILKNAAGVRFMKRYQPERMELAGRDEVARAIYQEIKEGRGTKHGGVYLDTTHWEKGKVEKIIPDVFATFIKEGIDIRKEMMEISPTMHHMMGGVRINEWGETNIRGFYAVGEITGGIHGANRLGGNSLAEGQVFGRRVGIRVASFVKRNKFRNVQDRIIREEISRIATIKNRKLGLQVEVIIQKLKDIMWDKVGIIRNGKLLSQALYEIRKLKQEADKVYPREKRQLQQCLEVQEMLKTAEVIIIAALTRKESRGAHFRSDYPNIDKSWEKNILVLKSDGIIKTKIIPVTKN